MKKGVLFFLLPLIALAQPKEMRWGRANAPDFPRMRMFDMVEKLNLSDEKAEKLFGIMLKHKRKMSEWRKRWMDTKDNLRKVLSQEGSENREKTLRNLIKEMEDLMEEREKLHRSFLEELKKLLSLEELAKFYAMFPPFYHSGGWTFQEPSSK